MEKSKMQLIKEWIETCDLLDGNKISVDYLKEAIDSYSIDRTPSNPIVEQYINGDAIKRITFDFSVTAPLSSQAIVNLANSKFCEDFMDWVSSQNKSKKFPKIEGAMSVECTSPGFFFQKTQTTAIYIIQMNFTYFETK